MKNAIVYDPYPKYMTDVRLDYDEDFDMGVEKNTKTLQMRNMKTLDGTSEFDISSTR